MPKVRCKFCEKIFKEQRYLDTHLEKGKECKKLRGVLFVCLRCNCFHTTKFGKLEQHLENCKGEGRVIDIIETYQTRVKELQEKLKILEGMTGKVCISEDEEEKDIVELAFGTFTEHSPIKFFQDAYKNLLQIKQYNTALRKIKKNRRAYFSKVSLEEYTTTVRSNIKQLEYFGKSKKFSSRKVDTIISNHFTTLDLRLVRYKNYENFHPDGTLLKDLNLILSCKDLESFSYDVIENFRNYSLSIFPLHVILEFILYNRAKTEPVFVFFKISETVDPFHFYFLKERKGDKRLWNMDCGMEQFSESIRSSFLPYLISEFRKNYYHIFQDNIFRVNFIDIILGLEIESRQIIENILILANSSRTVKMCKKIVMKNSLTKTSRDILNLVKSDPIKGELFDETASYISQLFDDNPENLLSTLKNI